MLRTLSAKARQKCIECRGRSRASGAPLASATCFRIGHTARGTARGTTHLYRVVKSGSSRRWVKVKSRRTPTKSKSAGKGVLASVSAKKKEKCASDRGKFRASGAPKASATCFKIGHTEKGRRGALYKIIKSGKTRRWTKL